MAQFAIYRSDRLTTPILVVHESDTEVKLNDVYDVIRAHVSYFIQHITYPYVRNMSITELNDCVGTLGLFRCFGVTRDGARREACPTICLIRHKETRPCMFNSCSHIYPELIDRPLCRIAFTSDMPMPHTIELKAMVNPHMKNPILFVTRKDEIISPNYVTKILKFMYARFANNYKKDVSWMHNGMLNTEIDSIEPEWTMQPYSYSYADLRASCVIKICTLCNGEHMCRHMYPEAVDPMICYRTFVERMRAPEPTADNVPESANNVIEPVSVPKVEPEPVSVPKVEPEPVSVPKVEPEPAEKKDDFVIVPNQNETLKLILNLLTPHMAIASSDAGWRGIYLRQVRSTTEGILRALIDTKMDYVEYLRTALGAECKYDAEDPYVLYVANTAVQRLTR
jgi:hypothetical protein